MSDLPLKALDEIENIMEYNPEGLNEDIYGTKNKGSGIQTRKMADTYKRVREIATKYSNSDQEMEEMLAKYAVKKELFKRKPSNQRHGQLKSLDITNNQNRLRSLRRNQDMSTQ